MDGDLSTNENATIESSNHSVSNTHGNTILNTNMAKNAENSSNNKNKDRNKETSKSFAVIYSIDTFAIDNFTATLSILIDT